MAVQRLAGLDQRERLAGIDPKRLQHFGGQHLAHAAFQRQPTIGGARPWGSARALGGEIEEALVFEVIGLRKQEPAPIAEEGIIGLKLMAVIAQRQRLLEAAGQRLEAAEMGDPLLIGQTIEADPRGPALIAMA